MKPGTDQHGIGVDVNINAWRDAWIPVRDSAGESTLSLRDVLARAETLHDLGSQAFPIEREALLRLLYTTAAVGLRAAEDDDVEEFGETGQYPQAALAHLDTYADRFDVNHTTKPFLQIWGLTPHPDDEVLPLANLDPHQPGSSSSTWGLRPVDQDPGAATLLRSLVVTWFHSKWSNKTPATGLHNAVKGAPGYGGMRDLTLHWVGTNLGLTLAAAIPLKWVEDEIDLPVFLDQDHTPPGPALAADPQSLWRATYTPNRPALCRDAEGHVDGYIIGCVAGTLGPIPALAPSEVVEDTNPKTGKAKVPRPGNATAHTKAVLAVVHERDITRAYRDVAKKGQPETIRKVTSKTHHLLSAEGAVLWFRDDLGQAVADWEITQDRVASASHADPAWRLGCYLEECDKLGGTRKRSDWVVLDSALLTVTGPTGDAVKVILAFANKAEKEIRSHAGVACEGAAGSTQTALANQAGNALYTALDDLVLDLLASAAAHSDDEAEPLDHVASCREVLAIAERVLREQTEPLRNPANGARVEIARATFARALAKHLPKTAAETTEPSEITKDAA